MVKERGGLRGDYSRQRKMRANRRAAPAERTRWGGVGKCGGVNPMRLVRAVDDARLGAPSTVRPLTYLHLPQRLEPYAHLIHQKLRLFPRRKVPALVELVVMDELGIRPLRPAPRCSDDLVRKEAHGNRDGDVLGTKVCLRESLPIKTSRRDCRVRQPEERDVVEHIVSRKACWLPVKSTCDELQTERVVVQQPGCHTDW